MDRDAFNWAFMPSELKPNWKRKANAKDGSSKLKKVVDIEETLKVLEQKEKSRKGDDETPIKDADKESDNVIIRKQFELKSPNLIKFLFNFTGRIGR